MSPPLSSCIRFESHKSEQKQPEIWVISLKDSWCVNSDDSNQEHEIYTHYERWKKWKPSLILSREKKPQSSSRQPNTRHSSKHIWLSIYSNIRRSSNNINATAKKLAQARCLAILLPRITINTPLIFVIWSSLFTESSCIMITQCIIVLQEDRSIDTSHMEAVHVPLCF